MRCMLLILLLAFTVTKQQEEDNLISYEDFYEGVSEYRLLGEVSQAFQNFLQRLHSTQVTSCLLGTAQLSVCSNHYVRSTICTLCGGIVETLLQYYHIGYTPDEIVLLLSDMCVRMQLQSEEVCTGMININKDVVFYILDNKDKLQPNDVCGIMFQGIPCGNQNATEWTIDVDLGEKPVNNDSEAQNQTGTLTVLQVTDIHYDPLYQFGNNAVCYKPLCCRRDDDQPVNFKNGAGSWGDYRNCDFPLKAILSMMEQIKSQHPEIDYVYFTGDIVDHAVWRTSRHYNKASFKTIYSLFEEYFGNIPVYATIGNHESHPVNIFAPEEITSDILSSRWVYESLAQYWSTWLPNNMSSILQGGHYTTLIKPGLRLVSLNNNYCYTYNLWLIYKQNDLGGQLAWLAKTLLEAEINNEKVHILAHIPTGSSDCLYAWSKEFRRIIDRFESTVAAIFNGHTHNDEFQIYYSVENATHPISVAFNGGSATTYSYLNPNYRVYQVESNTGEILDHETWIYNLTEANQDPNGNPVWYKLYSFLEAYGVDSLSLGSLDSLTHKMAAQPDLIQQYWKYKVKEGDPELANGCDENCLFENLCQIVTSYPPDTTQCDILKKELASTLQQAKTLQK